MLDLVAGGFSFPTSLAFDDAGGMYVAESGLPFGGAPPGGRVWRVGAQRELLIENLRAPVNGLTFHRGRLYVSEGGHPARISCFDLDGKLLSVVLDNLPGPGNYHTNMVVFGPDEKLYFSQGALTNTGIIGLDAYELGWLRRLPHGHDLPGYELALNGVNVETRDPLHGENARTETGAFVPFGVRTQRGQRVEAQLPCTSAVMRCNRRRRCSSASARDACQSSKGCRQLAHITVIAVNVKASASSRPRTPSGSALNISGIQLRPDDESVRFAIGCASHRRCK